MNMNQDPQEFEQLRRLLALKRHEVPPPGYFGRFSGEVIARIEAGDRGEEASAFVERLLWEAPWLQRIWAALEAKPILAGAFGVAVCSLLISGAVYSGRVEPHAAPAMTMTVVEPNNALLGQQSAVRPIFGQTVTMASSTGGIATAQGHLSLFPEMQVQRAVLTIPSGN